MHELVLGEVAAGRSSSGWKLNHCPPSPRAGTVALPCSR